MIRIGYAPGAYDLFHIGHLNLLRRAKQHCEYLIAGVAADELLIRHKGVTPVIPLAERVEIVRNVRFVDTAVPALTNDKVEIWKDLRFNVLFKGNDWQGTEKGDKLERDFTALGVEVVYFPYTLSTSSSALRRALLSAPPEWICQPERKRILDMSALEVDALDLNARTGVCRRKSGGNVSGIVETRHR